MNTHTHTLSPLCLCSKGQTSLYVLTEESQASNEDQKGTRMEQE